jgi:hypothetical protein
MRTLGEALWNGLLSGAFTRDRASAVPPAERGYAGPIAQALYWFGFELSNVVVFGARR